MIGIVDVSVQAHNPSMPLFPMRAFEGSPSSVRIRSVPKKIGNWQINKVYFSVVYPDNSTQTAECKLVGGVYVGTIAGCNTVGNVKNGYSIYADGVDENGNAVTNYCLGKGDIQILDASGITQPLQNTTFVQILSAHPTTPNDGDMWYENDAWYVWQNDQAFPIGDDSGLISQVSAELSTKQDKLTDTQISAIDSVVSGDYLTRKEAEDGYTEWVITPPYFDEGTPFELTYQEQYGWVLGIRFEGGVEAIGFSYGPQDVTTLTYTNIENVGTVTAERCRITPTKTSQLSNDGADGINPFATVENLTAYALSTDVANELANYLPLSGGTLSSGNASIEVAPTHITFHNDYTLTSVNQQVLHVKNPTTFDFALLSSDGVDGTSLQSQLLAKQDKLNDAQLSAVNQVVDERATIIDFGNGDISSFNWSGTIDLNNLLTADLWNGSGGGWKKQPIDVKIGTMVSCVGYSMFDNCSELTSVTMTDSIKVIDQRAFRNCPKLQKADLPNSVSSIGNNAFSICSALIDVTIPKGLKDVGTNTFLQTGISSVTIEDGFTDIGAGMFAQTRNLTHIEIPSSVSAIGTNAFYFYQTQALTSVVFKDKTLAQVSAMSDYPWGINDTSIISTYNAASQEWVTPRLSYSLLSSGSVQLEDRAVQHVSLELSATVFTLPQLISGKVNDFVLDVTNTYTEGGTPAAASFSLNGTIDTDFNIVVPKDESFAEMTTLEAGEMAEFYFTRTSFGLGGLPTWKVVKQVVDQYTPTAI